MGRQGAARQEQRLGRSDQFHGDPIATRFQGIAASRRAMPQKPLSQIQPGATVWLRITPSSTRLPAAICTWRIRGRGAPLSLETGLLPGGHTTHEVGNRLRVALLQQLVHGLGTAVTALADQHQGSAG